MSAGVHAWVCHVPVPTGRPRVAHHPRRRPLAVDHDRFRPHRFTVGLLPLAVRRERGPRPPATSGEGVDLVLTGLALFGGVTVER